MPCARGPPAKHPARPARPSPPPPSRGRTISSAAGTGHRHRPGHLARRRPGRGRADHPRRARQPAPALPGRAAGPGRRLRRARPDRLPAGGPLRGRPALRLADRGPARQGLQAGAVRPVHRHQHPRRRDRRRGHPGAGHQGPAPRPAQPRRGPAPAQRRTCPDRPRCPAGPRGLAGGRCRRLPQPGGCGGPRGPDRGPDRRAGDRLGAGRHHSHLQRLPDPALRAGQGSHRRLAAGHRCPAGGRRRRGGGLPSRKSRRPSTGSWRPGPTGSPCRCGR